MGDEDQHPALSHPGQLDPHLAVPGASGADESTGFGSLEL